MEQCWEISRASLGLVIGKHGSNLKKMEQLPGVRSVVLLNTPHHHHPHASSSNHSNHHANNNSSSALLTVRCSSASALQALRELLFAKMQQGALTDFAEKSPFHESWILPDECVGLVIGKKGANLQAIREISGITFVGLEKRLDGHFELKIGGRSPDVVAQAMSAQKFRRNLSGFGSAPF